MKNSFKLALLLACGLSINTYASEVFTASPDNNFEFQFSALFLKPSGSNLHYAAQAEPLPLVSPNWDIFELTPRYYFGFDLGFAVNFCERATNLKLNWERFHANRFDEQQVPNTDMVGPFFEIGPDATPYGKAAGRVQFRFDEVHLDYGQFVNIGEYLTSNIFAGLSFARIEENAVSVYASLNGNSTRTINVPSKFTGAGPQFGLDCSYCITECFGLETKTAASLLAGKMKNHTTYASKSPLLDYINTQSTTVPTRSQVVPGFEGKIGVSYQNESFCGYYAVHIEAGYQAKIYFNAIQSIDMGSQVVTPPVASSSIGVYARTFQRTLSNFALAGPYITLMIGF